MTYLQKPARMSEINGQTTKRVVSRRSQLEIRMDGLRAIMEGAEGPTQIMYKANLSWILLWDHLKPLTELGFVDEKLLGSRKKYSLTGKGVEIVRAYSALVREITLEGSQVMR